MTLSTPRTAEHLRHLVLTRNGIVPNFSLLLGSGASIASGVRTANDMVVEWRRLLFSRSNSGVGFQEWLTEQSWHDHEDEYSILFETIYDQPSQRRIFVGRVASKRPIPVGAISISPIFLPHTSLMWCSRPTLTT